VKATGSLLLTGTALGLAAFVLLAILLSSLPPPVTLQLISTPREGVASQLSYFCLSNKSVRPVVFLGDASGLPSYLLVESLELSPMNRSFLLTNYNQARLSESRQATLPPHSSVSFPVQIPSGVTNAILQVHFMRPKTRLESWFRSWYRRLTNRSSQAYDSISMHQPFTRNVEQ